MNRFKLFKIFCLVISIAAACYYPVKKVMQYEFAPAVEFDFKVEGFDPYDPGRGHFLQLQVYPVKADNKITTQYSSQNCYATVAKDKDGLATITGFTAVPGDIPCFKAERPRYFYNGDISDIYPFKRFYINEEIASDAERMLQNAAGKKQTCVLRVKLFPDGASAVTGLFIDGKDIRELARAKKSEK